MARATQHFPDAAFHVRVLLLMALFLGGSLTFTVSMLSTKAVITETSTETCGGARHVDQVVVLLIDALRPDFVLPGLSHHYSDGKQCTSTPAPSGTTTRDGVPRGSLRYIEEGLRNATHPSHGFFFVADTPTVTGQRLKAITTGTIPAFLEAGSNLNTNVVESDSLLRQLSKRAIILGDDTWLNLFPDNDKNTSFWKRSLSFRAFNMTDFFAGDEDVHTNLLSVLREETVEQAPSDHAKLVIAHFSGVDHIGHYHHSDHPVMHQKLHVLDKMLRNVSHCLRYERRTATRTLLLVFGDHGMLNSGDHGSETYQETDTFLYVELFDGTVPSSPSSYSAAMRRKADMTQARWLNDVDEELKRLAPCRDAAGVHRDKMSAAFQVDLTPTIATLLGVPIPFSSLGRIMPEVVTLNDADADIEGLEKCNWQQLLTYFERAGAPIKVEWKEGTLPWQNRIAQMSQFGRETGNSMEPFGMFVGSCAFMTAAFSLAWNEDILRSLQQRPLMGMWTLLLLIFRVFALFSRGFIMRENVEVFCLLQLLLIAVLAATPRQSPGHFSSLVTLLVCLRLLVPLLSRNRSQFTNIVDEMSPLEEWILSDEKTDMRFEQVGILAGAFVFVAISLSSKFHRLATSVVATAMAVCYKAPLLHHIAPLCFFAYTVFVRGAAPLRYVALVLWAASLCNEKILASTSIAVYGAVLPFIVRATRHIPVLTQAVLLHLLSWVAFFTQGGHCVFTSIDVKSSFVGVPFHSIPLATLFVFTRMFSAFALAPMAVMLAHSAERKRGWRVCCLLFHLSVLQGSMSCFNGYIQRSCAMLLGVYAPKFVFDSVICLVSCVGYVLAICFVP